MFESRISYVIYVNILSYLYNPQFFKYHLKNEKFN